MTEEQHMNQSTQIQSSFNTNSAGPQPIIRHWSDIDSEDTPLM